MEQGEGVILQLPSNLFDGRSEVFYLGTASRKIHRRSGLSVLESQF